jgi:hypothetical protein
MEKPITKATNFGVETMLSSIERASSCYRMKTPADMHYYITQHSFRPQSCKLVILKNR